MHAIASYLLCGLEAGERLVPLCRCRLQPLLGLLSLDPCRLQLLYCLGEKCGLLLLPFALGLQLTPAKTFEPAAMKTPRYPLQQMHTQARLFDAAYASYGCGK